MGKSVEVQKVAILLILDISIYTCGNRFYPKPKVVHW